MRSILWGLLLTLVPIAAHGAGPIVPVQGVLADSEGAAIDGTVNAVFALYDDAEGINPLWTEVRVLDVRAGFFVAYLGEIIPMDVADFASPGALWLGVALESDPEMERVLLGHTPRAAYADTCGALVGAGQTPALASKQCPAGQAVVGFDPAAAPICATVGGGTGGDPPAGAYALAGTLCANSQVMIGVDAAGQPICAPLGALGGSGPKSVSCPAGQVITGFDFNGGLICVAAGTGGGGGGLQGSGTNKKLAMFTGSDTLDDSIITQSSSNKIGINTTNPGSTLEVKGDLEVSGDFLWGGNAFTSSSCVVMGGTSCSSACSKHGMSCYKAMAIDKESDSTSCSQSGFKFCCCK
jgi:hypothetical protein